MADSDILRHQILRPGQSQEDRLPPELSRAAEALDGREPGDLLQFTASFAELVRFYQADGAEKGDWTAFLPRFTGTAVADDQLAASLLDANDGLTPPHLGLLLAFLKLYEHPRAAINRFGARHLEFYFRQVLRFAPRPAEPDRAHVVVQLKKQAPPVSLGPEHVLSAGRDATQTELSYVPVRKTVLSGAKVASLRSIYLDPGGRGTVRAAPVANSSDGVGEKLEGDEPKWPGFGGPDLGAATVGFALASPVLRMKEGARKVRLVLTLGGTDLSGLGAAAVADAFEVFITGEKGWLGPYGIGTASLEAGALRLEFLVPADDGAVVDYDAAIHGQAYAAGSPVVQVSLRTSRGGLGYLDFRGVTLRRAQVAVDVSGVTTLELESDAGRLDPKKAFLPFTAEPSARSRFMIGYAEAFAKKLSAVSIRIRWQGVPASFSSQYADYNAGVDDTSFTASASIRDGGSWEQVVAGNPLFQAGSPGSERVLSFAPGGPSAGRPMPPGTQVIALARAGGHWARRIAVGTRLLRPMLWSPIGEPPPPRSGFLTLSLERDFLHAEYRRLSVVNALTFGKGSGTPPPTVLKEPYTPRIQGISLDYSAHSDEVSIESDRLEDFATLDLQFFHVGCFGQMREHGYQRRRFAFVGNLQVPLLPVYDQAGELLIGVTGLVPRGSVSLLFQVAEGSADPDLEPQEVSWWVLCDNYWKNLGASERTLDTTNGLLASGLISTVIPGEATADNTIMPAGMIWLRATVPSAVDAVSQLVDVAADAIEVRFADAGNDPGRLATPLPANRIAKLKIGPPGIKTVLQPYASFGGSPAEANDRLTRRAAERLRHKSRCISAWDYERMVLEEFPVVHRVKCVAHARDGVWLAPGHVLLVVIPDLRNRNARDPLKPKVDADTISRIGEFVQGHAGMQVQVHVKNPRYQEIKLDFGVKLRPGYEFNYYRAELVRDLIRYLSPWAYDSERTLGFGGQVYRSVLLAFVESREAVDYVTDFRMTSSMGGATSPDLSAAVPETPDAILVSALGHVVRNVA